MSRLSEIAREEQIPENWGLKRLGDLANYYNGMAFKPSDWKDTGLPIIRIEQINNPLGDCDYYDGPVPEINKVRNGDLLFAWSATLTTTIWKWGDAVLNQHIFKVEPKNETNKFYLHYLLNYVIEELSSQSHGSTMKHIKRSDLMPYKVPIPNEYKEQQKIAEILTTVDNIIEKTEQLIEKYKKVKEGTMQDLFTKGIDETGCLRPSCEEAPHLYKETELGIIPKEWDIGTLKSSASDKPNSFTGGPFGSDLKTEDYTESGIQVIQLQNIGDGYFLNDYEIFTSEDKANELLSCNIYPGDIIIAKMADPVARACIIPDKADRYVMASDGIRLNVDKSRFNSDFLVSIINNSSFRNIARKRSTGSTRERIGLDELRNIPIKIPSKEEQANIAKLINKVDKIINSESKYNRKLKKLKQGLMQDLLTGKVRVKV